MISKSNKLKFEKKFKEAITLSNSALRVLVEESPDNKIDPSLLLILFNNLFVLNAATENLELAPQFGKKWIKVAERLLSVPQIVSANCSMAVFYLKHNHLPNAVHEARTYSTAAVNAF